MTNENNITIFLTIADAELFKSFREHQDDFFILKQNGIFNMKGGSLTVHFDNEGMVRKIESNRISYLK